LQALALLAIGQARTTNAYQEVSNAKNKKIVKANEMLEVLNAKMIHKGRFHLVKFFH